MGSYTNTANTRSRFVRFPTGLTETMTDDDLDLIIEQIEGEIEMVLASRDVAVPVTTPSWFLARLRSLASDGSAAIALKSIFPEVQGPGSTPAYAYYETRYRQGLLRLERMTLPGTVVRASTRVAPSTYFTKYPTTPPTLEENEKGLFDVDKVF